MIYFIGGPPKCGKTTLAKKLSQLKSIPYVSTDTLQNVVKPYCDSKKLSHYFPSTYQRAESNDEKYNLYSTSDIIEAYRKQAKTLYEAIDMFVLSEIIDGNDFILEGYHLEPELIAQLELKYPGQIKSVFLLKNNKEKFISDIPKSTTPNDWILVKTNDSKTYLKIAKMISEYSKSISEESKKYGLKSLCMDFNFDVKIQESISYFS